jgi:hypothetical protein
VKTSETSTCPGRGKQGEKKLFHSVKADLPHAFSPLYRSQDSDFYLLNLSCFSPIKKKGKLIRAQSKEIARKKSGNFFNFLRSTENPF